MDEARRRRIGKHLQQAREAKSISQRRLAKITGIDSAIISRIEAGLIATPDPEKLQAMADVIGITVTDLFTEADWLRPRDLSPSVYLRTVARDLPPEDQARLAGKVADLLKESGIDVTDGPAPGEDEA